MKKIRTEIFLIAAAVLLFEFADPCFSATDFGAGVGVSSWDSGVSGKNKIKTREDDPYIKALAGYFTFDNAYLQKLWTRGYGRNELIKLVIISLKSGKELKEIVGIRQKKTKLERICAKYGLDHTALLEESASARKEIDKAFFASSSTVIPQNLEKNVIINSSGTAEGSVTTEKQK